MEKKKTFIFISWSKPLGMEVAHVLKKFLTSVLGLKRGTDIFVSSQNLTGNDRGWFEELRTQASTASIFIPCITKDSIDSPWLHFETGIGTSIKEFPTKIVPFLFNVGINDLGDKLRMYNHYQMVHSDIMKSKQVYEDLLCLLVFYISTFLNEEGSKLKEKFDVTFCCYDYESFDCQKIKDNYSVAINTAVNELESIAKFYDLKDFYISRPIQGLLSKDSKKYEKVLDEMEMEVKRRFYTSFRGYSKIKDNIKVMSFSRIEVIKKTRYFVLIYPFISGDNIPPSSCLIELGGALAYGKDIVLFIQKGAILPAFLNELTTLKNRYFEYKDINDLKAKWIEFLDNLEKE